MTTSLQKSQYRSALKLAKQQYAELESHALAFGRTIRGIRDEGVYKDFYNTFEEFILAEFGVKKRQVYYCIEAAETKDRVCTIVHKEKAETLENTGQLRELRGVSNEKLEPVIDRAAELAEERGATKPAAVDLKQAREELVQPTPSSNGKPKPAAADPADLVKKEIAKTLQAAARAVGDYHDRRPNRKKHDAIVKLIQQAEENLW